MQVSVLELQQRQLRHVWRDREQSFDQLVRVQQERLGNREADRLRGLEKWQQRVRRVLVGNSALLTIASPASTGLAAALPLRCCPEREFPIFGSVMCPISQVAKRSAKSRAVAALPTEMRTGGRGIIAPRRTNSAHLHRPWRANYFCQVLLKIMRGRCYASFPSRPLHPL